MHIFYDKGADMSTPQDTAEQVVRAAPGVTATALTWLFSVNLNQVLLLITIVFTMLQTYVLVRDRIVGPWRERRNAEKAATTAPASSTPAAVKVSVAAAPAAAAAASAASDDDAPEENPTVDSVASSAAQVVANGLDGQT